MKFKFYFHKIPFYILIGTPKQVMASVTEPGIYYACHAGDPKELFSRIVLMLDTALLHKDAPAGMRTGRLPNLVLPIEGKYLSTDLDPLIACGINPIRIMPGNTITTCSFTFVDVDLSPQNMVYRADREFELTQKFKQFAQAFDADSISHLRPDYTITDLLINIPELLVPEQHFKGTGYVLGILPISIDFATEAKWRDNWVPLTRDNCYGTPEPVMVKGTSFPGRTHLQIKGRYTALETPCAFKHLTEAVEANFYTKTAEYKVSFKHNGFLLEGVWPCSWSEATKTGEVCIDRATPLNL